MPPSRAKFQAFTLRFTGKAQQLVTDIQVLPAFDPANPPPSPAVFATKALWDTGASKSCISPKVVAALSLASTGTAQVFHAGGAGTTPTYVVNFQLPNRVGAAGVLVSEFPSMGNNFEVLVGMDIIGLGDLALTHVGGKTCMSFRIPSVAENDFVQEGNRLLFAGVGRNDACPCGAKQPDGRPVKFKNCHGRTAR